MLFFKQREGLPEEDFYERYGASLEELTGVRWREADF
jgi:hypothetical protein